MKKSKNHKESQETNQNNKPKENFEEKFLRVTADFQNYKRRMEKEQFEWIADGKATVLKKLLFIVDDLDRAIKSGSCSGLELIKKNLDKALTNLGVEEIDCSGEFDPELHEAMVQVDLEDHESGHIVDVLNKGYRLGDEVIRHAKVSVAK